MGVGAAELLGTEAVPGKIFTSTMKFVLMSLLLAGSSLAMDDMFKKIMKETAFHTFNAACFGENNKNLYDLAVGAAMEKCMQLAPATGSTHSSPASRGRIPSSSSRLTKILTS